MTTTGEYLTQLLASYGVDTVFGIPGVHTIELYRGLTGSGIRHVTPRHEQGAGFMADGYARACGRPGVCFIISGPGMTNIATPMGQAYGDSIPMLVISSVNAHGRLGSGDGWLHELPDQRGLIAGVAAFSRTIHTPAELAPAIAQAFALFDGARPRPVHIEIPIDVLHASATHLSAIPDRQPRLVPGVPAPAALDDAADRLGEAERPVILAGGGALGGAAPIRTLAERLGAPVVLTTNARGLLPPDHPLQISLSPSLPAVREVIAEADVVLALGTELGSTDYDFDEDGGFRIDGDLIRVDLDPQQMMRGVAPALGLIGDAAQTTAALVDRLAERDIANGAARAARVRGADGDLSATLRGDLAFLDTVRDTLPDALIVGDSTQLVYAGNIAFAAATPGSYWNSATGFGTLGYGLPAGIGAALACSKPVIALAGDGGFQFSMPELASATEAGVDLILLLHDNTGYGEIKKAMLAADVDPVGVDLFTPDFEAIGAACGWSVRRVRTPDEIAAALTAAREGGRWMLLFGDDLREAFAQKL